MVFSERLRQLRVESGLTQKELAEKLNLTHSTISKYERKELEPSNEFLIFIANYFDCTVDYLLGRTSARHIKIIEHDGYKIGVNNNLFPNNMSYEEVYELIDKLLKAGIKIEPKKNV